MIGLTLTEALVVVFFQGIPIGVMFAFVCGHPRTTPSEYFLLGIFAWGVWNGVFGMVIIVVFTAGNILT